MSTSESRPPGTRAGHNHDDLLAEVKARTDIARVIGERVHLQRQGDDLVGLCPFHQENSPSFTVYSTHGNQHYHCYGCGAHGDVIGFKMRAESLDFRAALEALGRECGMALTVKGVSVLHPGPGVTLEALASAKRLPEDFLEGLGLCDTRCNKAPAVRIPYLDSGGTEAALRYRTSLTGDSRFRWRKGDKAMPYGLARLVEARAARWVLLVEGESDCWTAWYLKLPALGIPGKDTWHPEWAAYLENVDEVYWWQEPGAEKSTDKIGRDIPHLRVMSAPDGVKDISEAHIQGRDVSALLKELRARARPYSDIEAEKRTAVLGEAAAVAAPVLHAQDPLELVKVAIRVGGYGGDLTPAIVAYLAMTSRVLKPVRGGLPVHLCLQGPPAVGKSWAMRSALRLLPPEAYHVIDAGSPTVLIYDEADLQHRALIFSEADSIPAGEDSPAASAVRNLLQDHHLHYQATIRDAQTGEYTVKEVSKPGPTVLITTSTRRLGAQLDSRLFTLDMPDDQNQIRAALQARAAMELSGSGGIGDGQGGEGEDNTAEIAGLMGFQSLLQAGAPWDVVVPYAGELAKLIGSSPSGTRINRDYERLLSLVKTVALVRHRHRCKDSKARLVATLDDYRTVYDLVNTLYSATASGAGKAVRAVVAAVKALRAGGHEKVNKAAVAKHTGSKPMTAGRHIDAALRGGWLVNRAGKGNGYDLELGEPLPPEEGLPAPEHLGSPSGEGDAVTPDVTPSVPSGVSLRAEWEPAPQTQNGRANGSGYEASNILTPFTVSDTAHTPQSPHSSTHPSNGPGDGWTEEPPDAPARAGVTYRHYGGKLYSRPVSRQPT